MKYILFMLPLYCNAPMLCSDAFTIYNKIFELRTKQVLFEQEFKKQLYDFETANLVFTPSDDIFIIYAQLKDCSLQIANLVYDFNELKKELDKVNIMLIESYYFDTVVDVKLDTPKLYLYEDRIYITKNNRKIKVNDFTIKELL